MSSLEDRIAHAVAKFLRDENLFIVDGEDQSNVVYHKFAHWLSKPVAAVVHPEITSVEELDELPDFVVVRDKVGTVWEKEHHAGEGPWWETSSEVGQPVINVRLPARLLWEGGR